MTETVSRVNTDNDGCCHRDSMQFLLQDNLIGKGGECETVSAVLCPRPTPGAPSAPAVTTSVDRLTRIGDPAVLDRIVDTLTIVSV
jgi:hypothetical protein